MKSNEVCGFDVLGIFTSTFELGDEGFIYVGNEMLLPYAAFVVNGNCGAEI